uniref:Uncharacterized protein LOC100184195 n=1 Tax=Phallusia mammillata TaxID=59560 RepID=A0A6F9DIR9_9ASCI|nr:uncharacterized protein LOC100184195 [Phallusia mammillata]
MQDKQGIIIYSSVFAILSSLFFPPLVVVTYSISKQFQEYDATLQKAEDTRASIYLCLENANCTQYGKPIGMANTDSIAEKRVIFNNEKITEIVVKRISKGSNFDIKVPKAFGSNKVLKHIKEFSKQLTSPQLTYGHLTAKGQPKKTGDVYTMNSWEWQQGARFAFSSPFMYSNNSAHLNVTVDGVYKVYLHTTFVSSRSKSEKCQLSHQVNRKTGVLIKSSETVPNCRKTNQKLPSLQQNKPFGFFTLDTMGVYRLAKNETLTVVYQMPDHVTIGDADTQTYFGIFRV